MFTFTSREATTSEATATTTGVVHVILLSDDALQGWALHCAKQMVAESREQRGELHCYWTLMLSDAHFELDVRAQTAQALENLENGLSARAMGQHSS